MKDQPGLYGTHIFLVGFQVNGGEFLGREFLGAWQELRQRGWARKRPQKRFRKRPVGPLSAWFREVMVGHMCFVVGRTQRQPALGEGGFFSERRGAGFVSRVQAVDRLALVILRGVLGTRGKGFVEGKAKPK